jgi:indole-3-glycerol phosphate synthase
VLLIVGALQPPELSALIAEARACGLAALVEVHDREELARAADAGAEIVGVNSRNLRTLQVEPSLHDTLAPLLPRGVVAVAESGLREPADLARLERAGYHAFLVGERLIAERDPGSALARLRCASASERKRDEPRERKEPATRRVSDRARESEGRRPSGKND